MVMFRKLALFLSPKCAETYGFRFAQELDVFGKDVMKIFGITVFHRDYEDTWEWVEGKSDNGIKVNISRPHNWKTSDYEIPVIIRVSGPILKLTSEFRSSSAQRLADN